MNKLSSWTAAVAVFSGFLLFPHILRAEHVDTAPGMTWFQFQLLAIRHDVDSITARGLDLASVQADLDWIVPSNIKRLTIINPKDSTGKGRRIKISGFHVDLLLEQWTLPEIDTTIFGKNVRLERVKVAGAMIACAKSIDVFELNAASLDLWDGNDETEITLKYSNVAGDLTVFERKGKGTLRIENCTIKGGLDFRGQSNSSLALVRTMVEGPSSIRSGPMNLLLLDDCHFSNGLSFGPVAISAKRIFLGRLGADIQKFYFATAGFDVNALVPRNEIAQPVRTQATDAEFKEFQDALRFLRRSEIAHSFGEPDKGFLAQLDFRQGAVKGGLVSWAHRVFFGYGYAPWRFVVFVMLGSALVVGGFLYVFFAHSVETITARKLKRPPEPIHSWDFKRMLASSHLAFALMFSIKWNLEWITTESRFFAFSVGVYLYGFLLYVALVIGTKGAFLDSLRTIMGF